MNEKVIALERIRKLLTFWHEAGAELKPLCKSEEIRKPSWMKRLLGLWQKSLNS